MGTMHALSWSASQLVRCGAANAGGFWGDFAGDRLMETGSAAPDTFARSNRGLQVQPVCKSAKDFPQRPFSADSSGGKGEISGRQNVAGRVGKSSGDLRPNSKKLPSKSPQAASSVLRSTDCEEAVTPISSPASFLSSMEPGGFLRSLTLDEEAIATSTVFRMAIACCVVSQWIKIAAALSMWASRLRLKYFESPIKYAVPVEDCKLGGRIGVFWDLENCPVPSGCDIPAVIDKIRSIGSAFGDVQCFRAYGKLDYLTRQASPFMKKGVDLCPVPDGKESADKAIIMDAVLFAFDHKPCLEELDDRGEMDAVVIVTGDRGFAALLKELSKRNIKTVVVGNAHQALPQGLGQAANYSIGWDEMMIMEDFDISTIDEAYKSSSSDMVCYQMDSEGSELLCTSSGSLTCTDRIEAVKNQRSQCKSCALPDINKPQVPIDGRIRVLRHLRCEVAAVLEKYCSEGKCIDLAEFFRLYEEEMGHALVPSYYGFGSLKVLLQSMPDLVSLRLVSTTSSEMEVFPYYAKGKSALGRVNYTKEDLRCILYELLLTHRPYGVRKDTLSREHLKITGRPLVLVTYEYLKTGDIFNSMRDLMYIDSRSKQLRLIDGVKEPSGYTDLVESQWN